MSTIQLSKGAVKNTKNHVKLSRKFQWKSCSATHLHFLPSNLRILKAFPGTFSFKLKHT